VLLGVSYDNAGDVGGGVEHSMMNRIWLISIFLVCGLGSAARADDAVVQWESDDGLFLAGANIVVTETVEGDLRASGDSILIADDVTIDGDAWLAGRRIVVDGAIDGDLDIRGQSVLVNGPIEGNVSIWAVDLTLGPDAEIGGDLVYYTNEAADIAVDVHVDGETEAHFFSDGDKQPDALPNDWRGEWESYQGHVRSFELSLPGVVVLAFFAGLISLVAPRWSDGVQMAAQQTPALAVFYGLVWMLGLPVVAIFAAFTIIGIPFAVLLIALYGIVFLVGTVVAVLVIGGFLTGLFNQTFGSGAGERVARVLIGSLVLWAGAAAPLLGGFFWFATISISIGAILIAGRVRYETV